jgi:hypothetical protein
MLKIFSIYYIISRNSLLICYVLSSNFLYHIEGKYRSLQMEFGLVRRQADELSEERAALQRQLTQIQVSVIAGELREERAALQRQLTQIQVAVIAGELSEECAALQSQLTQIQVQ